MVHALGVSITLIFLFACTPAPPPPGTALTGADHPLAGRIWSVDGQRFLSEREFAAALGQARFILLGEAHDNPRHHNLQAWALRTLAEGSRTPAVAMEMIGEDQAGGLDLFYGEPRANADRLPFFLKWKEAGWPDWTLYAPVADTAVRFGMPIVWANFARETVIAMYGEGWDALSPERRARLGLPAALPPALKPAMEQDIADSHCGSLPPDKITRFAEIQFARDSLMAERMITTAGPDGTVLITGAGHARIDRGVPYHLGRLGTVSGVLSVGFVEVDTDRPAPDAYDLPFDLVWFTPAVPRKDPCGAFNNGN